MSEPKQIESGNQATSGHASSSTTPPVGPFSHLPDLCLLALFRQLPPADQISARKSCQRWSVLVPVANQPHARSLTIAFNRSLDVVEGCFNSFSHGHHWKLLKLLRKEDGTPLLPMYSLNQWNSLQFSTLDEVTVSQIVNTFPVVKELQLYASITTNSNEVQWNTGTTSPPDLLVCLLEQWRPQLTKLNLIVNIPSSSENLFRPSLNRLFTAINSLSALKHLGINLYLSNLLFLSDLPDLPIVSQLTQFTINSSLLQFIDLMLRHYDPVNSPLKRITFAGYPGGGRQLTSLSENLRQLIVRFEPSNSYADYQIICNHLQSLTSVHLNAPVQPKFRIFLTDLSQLTELIYLRLHINFRSIHLDDQPLPQLKSIKFLQLIFGLRNHCDLEQLNLAWTMPNVQVIELEFNQYSLRCTTCGYSYRPRMSITYTNKMKQCLRQIFTTLKRHCVHLHTIKHTFEKSLGTAEELLG